MDEQTQTQFNGWALVEIMGHRRAVGMVTTEYIGTAALLKIVTPEVPATEYTLEKDAWIDGDRVYAGSRVEASRPRGEIWVGSGSIYALTPITEADVLAHAPVKHTVLERAQRAAIGPAPEVSPNTEPGEPDDDTDSDEDLEDLKSERGARW